MAGADKRTVDSPLAAAGVVPSKAPSPPRPPAAPPESTIAEYFRRVIPTNHTTVFLDSLFTCRDFEAEESARWLAVGKVERVRPTHADTVIVTATLTTVAHVQGPATGATVTQGIEEQTAEFQMVRAANGNWMVCGDLPLPGYSLISWRPNMKWLPKGASPATAYALIDSIRKARGLPLIR